MFIELVKSWDIYERYVEKFYHEFLFLLPNIFFASFSKSAFALCYILIQWAKIPQISIYFKSYLYFPITQ